MANSDFQPIKTDKVQPLDLSARWQLSQKKIKKLLKNVLSFLENIALHTCGVDPYAFRKTQRLRAFERWVHSSNFSDQTILMYGEHHRTKLPGFSRQESAAIKIGDHRLQMRKDFLSQMRSAKIQLGHFQKELKKLGKFHMELLQEMYICDQIDELKKKLSTLQSWLTLLDDSVAMDLINSYK